MKQGCRAMEARAPSDYLLALANVLFRLLADPGVGMARNDVAEHPKRAIVREVIDRIERLLLHRSIGIVEHGSFEHGLRPVKLRRVADLFQRFADRIK